MDNQSDTDVAAKWDQNADQWTNDVRAGFDVFRDLFTLPAFEDFLPSLEGLSAVDFGCGEGSNTRRFAQAGAHMAGIDLSERMITYARNAEETEPLGIKYKVSSYSGHTGFPDRSFDAVLSTMALMDGPDINGAMHEAYRLLRPGGFLAFSVLHPCFFAPGLRWRTDENGVVTDVRVPPYFDRTGFTQHWQFGNRPEDEQVLPFAVPRFPRTISDYLNAVSGAGFRITSVQEPRPAEKACEAVPRLNRWRNFAAFLLLVKAGRPA